LKLNELNIFKNEKETLDFIRTNNLNLVSKTSSFEIKILTQIENLFLNYFQGKKLNLYDEIKNLQIELEIKAKFKTEFTQKVINALLDLKSGEITTYYDIGNKINSKAYRAIGNVCKSNPIPLIIPCHRVLRKNGEIGGFMGKSDKTWETDLKKQLLRIEGYKI